jgi:hypothetical protein
MRIRFDPSFKEVSVGQGSDAYHMTDVKSSFYGRVRRTAYDLWRGPRYMHKQDENDPVGGHCVLRLAIQKGTTMEPMIEARAVYTAFGTEMEDAVLRAFYWDGHTFVHNIPSEETHVKIPVKFVQISGEQLQHWLRSFAGLSTSIQISSPEGISLPICSLRIETSLVDCAFEKVWTVVQDEDRELNRVWQETWQQMGVALQTASAIADVEESFPNTRIEPDSYDFQSYQPSLSLP